MIKLKSLINEIEFTTQKAFDTYAKNHKLRPDTKVKIAGKTTTAGAASKPKGVSVFSKDYKGEDPMATVNNIASKTGLRPQAVAGWADENGVNLSMLAKDIENKKLKPLDVMTAVSGNPQNKYAQQLVSKYSNSSVNKKSDDLTINPDYKYQNAAKKWLDDTKGTKTYDIAKMLMKGEKDPDEKLGIQLMPYANLLKGIVRLSGESEHDDKLRNNQYTISDLENWAKEKLEKVFTTGKKPKGNDLDKAVSKIEKLTDTNQHTNAVIELAKMIGDEKAIKQLQKIDAQHMKIGSMPMNLINKRRDIRTALLNTAKEKYGEEGYNKLKSSF